MNAAPALGLYIHWPYCERICPYCDFNVRRDRGDTQSKSNLAEAIGADLAAHAALTGARNLVSIYFGGGTPSLMEPAVVERLIGVAAALWTPTGPLEVTLEANPGDLEPARLRALAGGGVNRLSIGVQSLRDASLRRLGRNHDATAARRAVEAALTVFQRVSIDLIYALPGQSPAAWAEELADAAALGTEHISAYQLTIEAGTPFARAAARGRLETPGSDMAADLFEITQQVLGESEFDAYEVSSHARGIAARSRHNLVYWRGEDYVGVGPGAHGRLALEGRRWECVAERDVAAYIAAPPADPSRRRPLDAGEAAVERLILGLRTSEGVPLAELTPLGLRDDDLAAMSGAGLIDLAGARITVPVARRLVLDRLLLELAVAREEQAS